MTDRHVLAFIKFFEKEEYADEFINGHLYFSRLSFFKALEDADSIARGDRHEGLHSWHQADRVQMVIEGPLGRIEICSEDLAGPVTVSRNQTGKIHVFCIYTVELSECDVDESGRIRVPDERIEEIQNALKIDPRCQNFGRFAVVVTQPHAFLARLFPALESTGIEARADMVTYFDEASFSGSFTQDASPFFKRNKFSWQKEYRACLYSLTEGDGPYNLVIGPLFDIAQKYQGDDLSDCIKLEFQEF